MLIDYKEDEIILSPKDSKLKIRHISQLGLWGFKESSNIYVATEGTMDLLEKVIEYFKVCEIEIELSELCKNRLSVIHKKNKEFDCNKNQLREFKNGIIDENEYAKHIDSVNKLNRKLKDHQIKASFHLYKAANGANFSVPGSGKTTVVYAVYQRLKEEGRVDSLFVIGPPSCFGAWIDEYHAVFGRKPNVNIFAGGNITSRKEEYYKIEYSELNLSTFQTVARDYLEVPKLLSRARMMLVVDEAHYIKQVGGEWSTSVLQLSEYASYKVVLTGTPIPKSYSDFYNIFEFLYPDNVVISNTQKIKLKQYESADNIESATELLEETIGPLFYRVRKSELHLDKQIFHDPISVRMNEVEHKIYDAIITRIINYSKTDYYKNIDYVKSLIRGRMIRLRQCYSYTGLLSNTIDDYEEDIFGNDVNLKKIISNYDQEEKPAKIQVLMDLVNEHIKSGKKLLIWSNFIGTIKLIEKEIVKNGLQCEKIIGETPRDNSKLEDVLTREDIRKEFINPNSDLRLLLANPAACAESISLHTACNSAVYYDLSYNCAQYLQSLDRIHRVGGSETRPSHYYFLQYSDTYESDILTNLDRKALKMMAIVDRDYTVYDLDMSDYSDELGAYNNLFKQ